MDWRMLIRRCPSRSFTIVGDVAQTSALGGTRDWRTSMNALFGPQNWSLNDDARPDPRLCERLLGVALLFGALRVARRLARLFVRVGTQQFERFVEQ